MAVNMINKTDFELLGIKKGMYDKLDTEGWDEDEQFNEHLRDEFGSYTRSLGYGVYKTPEGKLKYWLGPDDPPPIKPRLDHDSQARMERQFYHKRIKEAVRATPEWQLIKKHRYKVAIDLRTYNPRQGSVVIRFAREADALLFKLTV